MTCVTTQMQLLNDFVPLNKSNHPKLFYSKHYIIYCDKIELLNNFERLNKCNHPKLFYLSHHIIYCDQREFLNDFVS